jgi:hypothetical protein
VQRRVRGFSERNVFPLSLGKFTVPLSVRKLVTIPPLASLQLRSSPRANMHGTIMRMAIQI